CRTTVATRELPALRLHANYAFDSSIRMNCMLLPGLALRVPTLAAGYFDVAHYSSGRARTSHFRVGGNPAGGMGYRIGTLLARNHVSPRAHPLLISRHQKVRYARQVFVTRDA